MIRIAFISILTVLLVGVTYWGYKEHEEKTALLIHSENNYQRSFHELSYYMDLLHDQIGTALVTNSSERLSPQFVEIWRISRDALANVGMLPLSLLPFNKTEEFLAQIGEFTYQTAVRDLDDSPLSTDEIKTLENFYDQSAKITDELRKVQHLTLQDNLRWMDVELALVTEEEHEDNTIIDGFKTVEKTSGEFQESNLGTTLTGLGEKNHTYKNVHGKKVTEQEVEQFTRKLFSLEDELPVEIEKSLDGADLATYSVTYEDGKNVYMEMTEKGGTPLNILVEREIKERTISLNEALKVAEKYLQQFDFKGLKSVYSQQFNNEGLFTFVYEQDDVIYYPDTILIKVALDDGEITGFNSKSYLMNHHDRKISKPKLSLAEAKKFVNANLKIEQEQLVVIESDLNEELLTYEFLGMLNGTTYRVFINANDGTEERVEKLKDIERNFDNV